MPRLPSISALSHRRSAAMAGTLVALLGTSATQAADDNWSNASASFQPWTTGTNWDLGSAPSASQSAAIANGGWAKIDSAVTFSSLTIGGASRLQLLDGANLSGGGAITNNSILTTANSGALTISNAIGGSGSLAVGGSGTLTLTGVNSYTGATTIAAGGTLAIAGGPRTIDSSINVAGTFDISQVTSTPPAVPNVDIKSLNGDGTVALGSKVLTVYAASGTFSGALVDGGIGGGTGGVFGIRGGTLTLTGVNTFHGDVANASNATLALAGNGSIANARVTQGGTFDISQTNSGATIAGLGNSGTVALGSKTLTIAVATSSGTPPTFIGTLEDGGIAGGTAGSVTIASGVQRLGGGGSYSGLTTISPGATLVLYSTGDVIASSSGLVNNGTLELQGSQVMKTVTGAGLVKLGTSTLTLTAQSGTFSGTIQDNSNPLDVGGTFSPPGGNVTLAGGTLVLTGANTYRGTTTITSGTVQLGAGGSLADASSLAVNGGTFDLNGRTQTFGALSGTGGFITLGAGALTTSSTASTTLASIISGSGSLTKAGTGALTLSGTNSYTGGTTVSAGTLQISGTGTLGSGSGALTVSGGALDLGGTTQTQNGGVTLNGGTIQNGALSSSGTFLLQSGTASAALAGSGAVSKTTSGTATLTGTNSYTGATTISAGTLQIGSGGTAGSISGNVANNGALAFNRSDAITFSGVISGSGTVTKAGTGTLTLSGANSYTGGTTVSAGTLQVAGTVGAVSVVSGGTLTGTGTVGTTSVASGGALSPGAGGTTGTLTVAGNLTLAAGSSYVDYITPTATGLTTVSGTAGVNGALTANAGSGTYTAGQHYTLITATGGVSGTFASLATPDLPAYVTGRLSYDANHVFLDLDATQIRSSLEDNASTNQTSISLALDTAVKDGKALNSGITSLYSQSGANLGTALNQAAGDIGAQASQAAGQSFSPFFDVLMSRGQANAGLSVAANGVPPGVMPAQLQDGAMNIWGSIYGGHGEIAADAAAGTASLSSGAFGVAGGMEAMLGDGLLAGASIGIGHQTFRSGGSSGKSGDVMLGLYGRKNFGQGYLSAAIGYGWHDIVTMRTVTLSGTDVLNGKFTANDFAGRIEGGYRVALDEQIGLTPFAAFAGDWFHTPAYTETKASGSANFALAYSANNSTATHSELGGRLDHDFAVGAETLSLEGMLAWAHQLNSRPSAQAAFADLPGSGFVLLGVKPATDTALLGLGLQIHNSSGLVYGARVQDQTGGGTDVITGALNLAYHW